MHYTLHLTNNCNMRCDYCYVNRSNIQVMDISTIINVIDMAAQSSSPSAGIIFFGGEPLLHKDLIYQTIEYGRWKEKHMEHYFHFKITTNGLLLDKEFIEFSQKSGLFIALSHDGAAEAHNRHRKDMNNNNTYELLSEKIDLLLASHPYAPVLMTVNPDTVQYYAKSVEYLYDKGFKYLICSMNYAGDWDQESLEVLRREYNKLADFYLERTLAEDKFYLSPFEVKISSHINRSSYCHERCELGKKQISVAPDGRLYPCVQFVYDEQYSIGHANTGIDEKRRNELFALNEAEKDSCIECAVKGRCNHHCGCLNKQSAGSIRKVSPVLCAHERILLPIADRLAEKLFKKRNALFIQKQYNDMFPLLSLIEDKTTNIRRP